MTTTLPPALPRDLASSPDHTMPPTPAAVVLLVQADADSRDMYAEFFRYEGLVPVPVSTARDGLPLAPRADVIVTGLLLPGDMDGIEFIARLKRDERTKRIPVIVVTACAWKSERERAQQAGCDLFLPKPCLPDDLVRDIQRLLAASKLRDVGEMSTKADLPSDVANPLERDGDLTRG